MHTHAYIIAAIALLAAGADAQSRETISDSASLIASTGTTTPGDTIRPPADFVMVDREPVVIKKVEPLYPALAMKAGMEGKVWVKVWVDSQGKAREVVILKSDADVFNGPAVEAARQFLFEPAQIKGKPVDVWVSIPFKFRLAEKKEAAAPKVDTASGGAMYGVLRFVIDVLQGPVPDSARVNAFVFEDAWSVAGGHQKPLRQSIDEQRRHLSSLEQPLRRMANCTLELARGERSGYIIARTEKGLKESTSHYHTVVISQDDSGSWKIMCWQSWQGGRTP